MKDVKKLFVYISLLSLFLWTATVFSQTVLVDDEPMCGHHDLTTYNALWDSLRGAGATIDFTTSTGRFPSLGSYDLVIVMHHEFCPTVGMGFTEDQRLQIIEYVCDGGNLLVMPIVWDDLNPHNQLLNDSRWQTGLYFGGSGGFVHTTNLVPFSPYTDGITYLHFEITSIIEVTIPAYPFVWDESGEHVIAAISYPRSSAVPCSCEAGGRIIALADNHTFEAPVVGYIEPMDHRFIVNVLEAACGLIPMPNCDVPPGIPAGEIDDCGPPGEELTVYGENLAPDIMLQVGWLTITPNYVSPDSTYLTFTVPDFPQGIYRVQLELDGRYYSAGRLQVYCEWIDLRSFAHGCYFIGDTVYFTGENISTTPNVDMEIIEPGGDTTTISEFEIIGSDSGWFIVPEGLDTSTYHYFFILVTNTDIGNYAESYIQIPCLCPEQDTLYSVDRSDPVPADTRDPVVTIIRPLFGDSCLVLGLGGDTLFFYTNADSFMSVPGLWPDRNPTRPISIELTTDGGVTWQPLATNQANDGNFFWMPSFTGPDFGFIVWAEDSFGNHGSDTIMNICVNEIAEPPLTGRLRPWTECEPESVLFTIRDSASVNMVSLSVIFDTLRFWYPDNMYWTDETTLVFFPPYPYPDSSIHQVRMSSMVFSDGGLRLEPDYDNAMCGDFTADYTGPHITPLYPMDDSIISFMPLDGRVIITDWSGVDESSIWITVNGEPFYISDPPLSFSDSILAIDYTIMGLSDTTAFEVCVYATDADTPSFCAESESLCFNFKIFQCMLVVHITGDTLITLRDSVQLFASDSLVYGTPQYYWQPGSTLTDSTAPNPIASPVVTTKYIVTVMDDSGCVAMDSILVRVHSPCEIHPKPFTPNNDGINDYAKFEFPGMGDKGGTLRIFDLDNREIRELENGDVIETKSGEIWWDGKDENGEPAPNGVYVFTIEVDGKVECNGTVYIAR